jgi:hypothetical protein
MFRFHITDTCRGLINTHNPMRYYSLLPVSLHRNTISYYREVFSYCLQRILLCRINPLCRQFPITIAVMLKVSMKSYIHSKVMDLSQLSYLKETQYVTRVNALPCIIFRTLINTYKAVTWTCNMGEPTVFLWLKTCNSHSYNFRRI